MKDPAIIVGGEVYEFSPRINEEDTLFNKINLKGQIGAVTKIKITSDGYIFTDEKGALWELDSHTLVLITDQYRVVDFAHADLFCTKRYYIITDNNDLLVIKTDADGKPQAPILINDTKFLKTFSGYGFVTLIDISGNLWCNSKCGQHSAFPARPTKGQLVYQVTDGFVFEDCGAAFSGVCALDSEGLLYIGGGNLEFSKTNCPIKFRAIAASLSQTAYIDFDNNLWMSGDANLCGVNVDTSEEIPITKVLENVDSVACNEDMTCALLLDGALLCTGRSHQIAAQWHSLVFEKVFDGHVDKLFDDTKRPNLRKRNHFIISKHIMCVICFFFNMC